MHESEEFRNGLKRAARKRVEEAARAILLNNDSASAKAHLEWAETANRILQSTVEKPVHPLRIASILVLLCLSLIVLAWTLPTYNNLLRLEARAETVILELDQPWELKPQDGIPCTSIRLDNLKTVNIDSDRPATSLVIGELSKGKLRKLKLPKGTRVDLERTATGLSLFVHGGVIEGEASAQKAELTFDNKNIKELLQSEPGKSDKFVSFTSSTVGELSAPFVLMLDTQAAWQLAGLFVRTLEFHREKSPESGKGESTLLKANGKFLEIAREFQLEEGDILKLEGVRSGHLTISRDGANAKLVFNGMVNHLKAGPEGFVQDMTPTLLEYLGHNQQLSFVWGALLFIYTLAWKFKGLFG